MLRGFRTFIVAGIGIAVNVFSAMHMIPVEYLPCVNSALGFIGLGTLRASIKK